MTVTINGTTGITDVNGSAAAPAITGTDTDTGVFFGTNTVSLSTNGTERLQVDSSGNMGLGVTPSAWSGLSTYRSIELGTSVGTGILGGANDLQSFANAYYSTGWKYAATGYATSYKQGGGAHVWNTAASGTAGNAITFTQAMTLDASGNLLVGTTSASGKLHVDGLQDGTAGKNARFSYNGTYYLELNELSIRAYNNPLIFGSGTSGSERARIDSSGRLLVGTTSTVDSATLSVKAVGGTVIGSQVAVNGNYVLASVNSSGTVVGGVIANASTTSFPTSSDYRLKENIAPMTGALATVAQLKPCTYTWKATGEDGQGFIAHELQEVLPDAVVGEKDAVDENGNPKYQGIDTSFLVATLTAAIQELKAEFDAYKAAHP